VIMSKLRSITIRQKLTAVIMLTSAIILLLGITAFIAWGQIEARRHVLNDLIGHAMMIGDNSKAALAFSDKEDAEQVLSALNSDASIVFACIYDKQGQVFVESQRTDITERIQPPEHRSAGYSFENGHLSVFQQIELDDELIGTVYLRDDMSRVRSELIWNIVFAMIILPIALLVSCFLALKLQKVISGPIQYVAEVSKYVSEKKDYSVRAKKHSNDEVGLLIDAFNDMLEQIQQRDLELVNSKEQLETKVQERTSELSSTNVKLAEEIAERSSAQRVLTERIKELNCLFGLSKLVEKPEITLGAIFQGTTDLIRDAYKYPDDTCVRITHDGIQYKTDNFAKSELSQRAKIKIHEEELGSIEVYYLRERGEINRNPFLAEERDLLVTVAEHLGRVAERKKTGDKLQLFRSLIDQSNDSVFVIEPKWGRFLDVNDTACRCLGYTREELLQMRFKDINENLSKDSDWTQYANEVRQEGYTVSESLYKRKFGTTFPVEINAKFIKQEKGKYILVVAWDITKRKKAEEELKRAAEEWMITFDSISDLVSIHDKDFKLVRVNKAFADAFGMKPEEVIGKKCYGIVHGTNEPPRECPHKRMLGTKKSETAAFFDPQLGIYLEVSTSPIFNENGQIIASVHIAKDITQRKQAEKRNVDLLKELESANRELKDFAYIVSHDLKAPLRGIKTIANWITTDYADKLDEDGKKQVNLLSDRVERMHNLIDGVLQYSRVGREREKQVEVNLNKLVPEIINMIAPAENIEITINDGLPIIKCEETRIMQVFQNLLSNAIKYMDKPKGLISIGCVQKNGFWKFSISDNGPGIEERHFEKIFQVFQTLKPRDQVEGTGVGLSVVKKIVEMYSGKIWVESKLGEGSTFFFTFPKHEREVVDDEKLEANIAC
jgi:two-component system sensor kinase FixL